MKRRKVDRDRRRKSGDHVDDMIVLGHGSDDGDGEMKVGKVVVVDVG